nr:MAG TPA: hypothetical protein [Caudoviricetes sp.]
MIKISGTLFRTVYGGFRAFYTGILPKRTPIKG